MGRVYRLSGQFLLLLLLLLFTCTSAVMSYGCAVLPPYSAAIWLLGLLANPFLAVLAVLLRGHFSGHFDPVEASLRRTLLLPANLAGDSGAGCFRLRFTYRSRFYFTAHHRHLLTTFFCTVFLFLDSAYRVVLCHISVDHVCRTTAVVLGVTLSPVA